MSTDYAVPPGTPIAVQPPLSEMERVVDTFIAPAKTFTDILRKASWWLPALLMVVFTLASVSVVDRQVGFERVSENQIHNSPRTEEAMAQMTPEQRAQRMKVSANITKYISYGFPVLLFIQFAIYALILWGCFNFLLGAQTTYGQVLATCFYASLPYLLLSLLTILTLYFGNNAEAYDYKNPVGTNLAYYMPDAAPWVKALLNRFDIIQLWVLGLTVFGMAIVARKTMMQSALVVGSLWFIMTIVAVVGGAFS